jgi:hypothetical protein
MAPSTLEERVMTLEHQVAELQTALANGTRPKDWRRTVGMFAGDDVMKRICDAALTFREEDRERARRLDANRRRMQG